jgi:hypothetical protein
MRDQDICTPYEEYYILERCTALNGIKAYENCMA